MARGSGVMIPKTNKVVIVPSITIYGNDGKEIGFITDFTPDSARRVERIRHASFTDAGRVIEQVPAPEDLTLRVTGFSLYQSSMIGRLAHGVPELEPDLLFVSLNEQAYPFTLEMSHTHPDDTSQMFRLIFGECWMTAFSHPWSIRNLYIAQTATLQPSWIEFEKK
jgi:hypothetical protein